ncbi:LysR substrate-binding domain-containing protein [Hirschia baltica]|uniref:Transcriptional regulator, LysR family n=1 Tax=Hirschia baltica (strain ATCC 49814 / DSM 5838 / IFAM 1418) TaxID=582402 RepID=C6XR06_HIRBI|nr:LysR substrate-binding domain-containing protein [Hirschia baltica]ACT60537.1 transcriptional regulator, LysR family [Hirschia baltica ATCC 49814]
MNKWLGIEEFVAVAKRGNFKLAAEYLGQSTSHVSRAVMGLEDRIHAPLFFRSTRQVTLTDTGRALFEQCRQLVDDRDEALAMVTGSGEPQGELRVTCSMSMGERFIAPILLRYAEQFPNVSVSIHLTNRIIDLTSEGFDLAIRTGYLDDSKLVVTRIASRRLILCAAPEYLEKHGRIDSIADLENHNCLAGTSTHWRFKVDGSEVSWLPKGRWRCNSGVAVRDAALSGMGLCQLPEFYVADYLKSGKLVHVLETESRVFEPIWAVCPERRHLLPKVTRLLDLLKSDKALKGEGV